MPGETSAETGRRIQDAASLSRKRTAYSLPSSAPPSKNVNRIEGSVTPKPVKHQERASAVTPSTVVHARLSPLCANQMSVMSPPASPVEIVMPPLMNPVAPPVPVILLRPVIWISVRYVAASVEEAFQN